MFFYLLLGCRETNKLKCLIDYLWDPEEAELFFSYLKRYDDTESLTFQLLFLLQRGRYVTLLIENVFILLNENLKHV